MRRLLSDLLDLTLPSALMAVYYAPITLSAFAVLGLFGGLGALAISMMGPHHASWPLYALWLAAGAAVVGITVSPPAALLVVGFYLLAGPGGEAEQLRLVAVISVIVLWEHPLGLAVFAACIVIDALRYYLRDPQVEDEVADTQLHERISAEVARLSERLQITAPAVTLSNSPYNPGAAIVGARKPRLVVYPTVAHMPPDRLQAVLAHELAHIQRLTMTNLCLWFTAVSWIALAALAVALKSETLLGLGAWLAVIGLLSAQVAYQMVARREERHADRLAADACGSPGALRAALRELCWVVDLNLCAHPHWWRRWLRLIDDHPHPSRRDRWLSNLMAEPVA